jgi:hypothetical protein
MSLAQNPDGAPLFVEYRPGTRRRIAAAVDALIALLDQIDGDTDLEEDDPPEDDAPQEDVGDEEPSLGSLYGTALGERRSQNRWADGAADDREDEHDGREPDVDHEPSLGSGCINNQTCWALGGDQDCELDDAEKSGCGDMDGVIEQLGLGVQFAE